jgi:ferredoxin-NADP reductase
MTYRYTVQSAERKDDVLLLTLSPKHQIRHMRFEPGQYAALAFTRGARPTPMRCFSIVSTPQGKVLQFAMRVRGNFTQTATRLQPGHSVYVKGPFGDFTINPEFDRQVVMLASGIGITPFLSMIRDATERRSGVPMTLLFSNRSKDNVPFQAQLQTLENQNPSLQVQLFAGDTTGKISEQHLTQLPDTRKNGTTFFICGSKNFAQEMQAALRSAGVHESRVISESFAQISSVTIGDRGLSIQTLTYGLTAASIVLITGFIMALDLQQHLAKFASAQTTSPSSSQNSGSSSSSPSSTNSSNSGTSSNSSTSTTQNDVPSTSTYQAPVSSQS